MDYKYIECLIERYFSCQTTLEEEQILKEFFRQDTVPQSMKQYKALFCTMHNQSDTVLSADFDKRLQERMAKLQEEKKATDLKVRIFNLNKSLSPFYKAVASIAIVITVGVTSSRYWNSQDPEPVNYNYASYHDTYTDPQVACEQVTGALKDLSEALKGNGLAPADTTYRHSVSPSEE